MDTINLANRQLSPMCRYPSQWQLGQETRAEDWTMDIKHMC